MDLPVIDPSFGIEWGLVNQNPLLREMRQTEANGI
jgi:hypothetical protein